MSSPPPVRLTAATVTGQLHQHVGRNNQDAWLGKCYPEFQLALVADGCSSSPHSEVGAPLVLRAVAGAWQHMVPPHFDQCSAEDQQFFLSPERFLYRSLTRDAGRTLEGLVNALVPREEQRRFIVDHLLCTVVGMAIFRHWSVLFHLGDGAAWVNGEPVSLGDYTGNAPPYLAYRLLDSSLLTVDPDQLFFQVAGIYPTAEVAHFLIGSDGVHDLEQCQTEPLPGGGGLVGNVSQFWTDPRYRANPHLVQRRLNLINTTKHQPDWTARTLHCRRGKLDDDTTLILGVATPVVEENPDAPTA